MNNSIASANFSEVKYPATPKTCATPRPTTTPKVEPTVARKLDLAKFPSIYQHGRGASQLEQVYMQFVSENMTITKPLSIDDLLARMGKFGAERLTLMLELLSSRGFLRSFSKSGRQVFVCNAASIDAGEDDLDMSS
uniref:Uncharacterized protein n=1 Tax=Lotharella oceanica TaxID=641309 RepID=A0A7S2XBN9_9EUKA